MTGTFPRKRKTISQIDWLPLIGLTKQANNCLSSLPTPVQRTRKNTHGLSSAETFAISPCLWICGEEIWKYPGQWVSSAATKEHTHPNNPQCWQIARVPFRPILVHPQSWSRRTCSIFIDRVFIAFHTYRRRPLTWIINLRKYGHKRGQYS